MSNYYTKPFEYKGKKYVVSNIEMIEWWDNEEDFGHQHTFSIEFTDVETGKVVDEEMMDDFEYEDLCMHPVVDELCDAMYLDSEYFD